MKSAMQIVRRKSHFYLYCDSVKIGIIFCQYRKKVRDYVHCLMNKLLGYVQIICDMPHSNLDFFPHFTCSSRTNSVVFNLVFSESNTIKVCM